MKYVPSIADEAEYDGDPLTIGSKVILKWVSKNVLCFLKLTSIDIEEKNGFYQLVFDCYDGVPKVPAQTLTFSVRKLTDDTTFFMFKHCFKSDYKAEYINLISKEKKSILTRLKSSLV